MGYDHAQCNRNINEQSNSQAVVGITKEVKKLSVEAQWAQNLLLEFVSFS